MSWRTIGAPGGGILVAVVFLAACGGGDDASTSYVPDASGASPLDASSEAASEDVTTASDGSTEGSAPSCAPGQSCFTDYGYQTGPYPCGPVPTFDSPTCALCCPEGCRTNADCPSPAVCVQAPESPGDARVCVPPDYFELGPACADAFCQSGCFCIDSDAGATCVCVPDNGQPCLPNGTCGTTGSRCYALDLPDGGKAAPTCNGYCSSGNDCAQGQDDECCTPRDLPDWQTCLPAAIVAPGTTCYP
jgi:hypothetical protein